MQFKTNLLAATVISLLAGCGGGSGGSDSSSSSGTTQGDGQSGSGTANLYSGLTTPASLNKDNAGSFADLLLDDVLDLIDFGSDAIGTADADGKIASRCGGSGQLKSDLSSSTLTGTIDVTFSQYDNCNGTVIDGAMQFDVTEYNQSLDTITKATVTLDNISFTAADSAWALSGIFTNNIDVVNFVESFKTDQFSLSDLTSGKNYQFKNYTEKTRYRSTMMLEPLGFYFDGKLYASDQGYVDISTNQAFVCIKKEQDACPFTVTANDRIQLAGEDGTGVDISFLQHDQRDHDDIYRVETLNSDNQITDTYLRPLNPTATSRNTKPFVYAGRNIEVQLDEVNNITLTAQASFDRDGDPLEYQWDVFTNYACDHGIAAWGDINDLVRSDNTSATFDISALDYGDYCIQLGVKDPQMQFFETDTVFVSFQQKKVFATTTLDINSPAFADEAKSIELMDIDADGDQDILAFVDYGRELHLYTQTGNGFSKHDTELAINGSYLTYAQGLAMENSTLTDFDGDGREDLLILKPGLQGGLDPRDFLQLYYYEPQTWFDEPVLIDQEVERSINSRLTGIKRYDTRDVNGDARPDIALLGTGFVKLYLQNNGSFEPAFEFSYADVTSVTEQIIGSAIVDDGASGDSEVLVVIKSGTEFTANFFIPANQGGPARQSTLAVDTSLGSIRDLLVADKDNDGKDELFLVHINGLSIYNLNSQGEWELTESITSQEQRLDYLLDDLNGDGLLDILAPHGSDTLLHLQDSNGAYTTTYRLPSLTDGFAIRDINGDNKKDIVVAQGDTIVILTNQL